MSKARFYCSFCGKRDDEVFKLIAGPTVFICDECVDLCFEICQAERHERPVHGPREAITQDFGYRLVPEIIP